MAFRQEKFFQLSREAARCTRCHRMKECQAVLSPANGPLDAPVAFVAEAPGRFGAARTGIPFQGDRSGKNFETLLASTHLTRKNVFITNAVLCNPLKNGNNHRPSITEVKNCSSFLQTTLQLVKPKVIVTLGGVALDAFNRILNTHYCLAEDAAIPKKQKDFILIPLYHPSPRVINTRRSLNQQKLDFRKILDCLKPKSDR